MRASLLLVPIAAVACSKSGIYPRADDTDTPLVPTSGTSACRGSALGCDSSSSTDADADTDADTDADSDADTDTDAARDSGGAGAWSHTVTVDGDVAEWTADELLPSTSGETWATWDATDLYVAVRHPDVGAGTALHWVVVYVGSGAAGTTAGATLGTQAPGLPTGMSHIFRWKADDSYHDRLAWDGLAWIATPLWLGTEGSAKQESNANNVLELRIPRASVGVGDVLDLHVAWVYEGAGSESTYAGSPATSFTDGAYDPDFGAYWRFDLSSPSSPASATPLP